MIGTNIQTIASRLNKDYLCQCDDMRVLVTVLDARYAYGRQEYLVAPSAGTGLTWVGESRMLFPPPPPPPEPPPPEPFTWEDSE